MTDQTNHQKSTLPDTQNQNDTRGVAIHRVGIRDIKYPFTFRNEGLPDQVLTASFDATVSLSADLKGTHMSRFVEVLHKHLKQPIDLDDVDDILKDLLTRLESETAALKMKFSLFIEKRAPVSGESSLMDYEVICDATRSGGQTQKKLVMTIPVTTLCPCSKAISRHGAHNQRGEVTVSMVYESAPALSDLIGRVERSASSELYALLKRADEKKVTEQAYEHPVFVEDLVRNVVLELNGLPHARWYRVEAENFESIHHHNAYACVEQ